LNRRRLGHREHSEVIESEKCSRDRWTVSRVRGPFVAAVQINANDAATSGRVDGPAVACPPKSLRRSELAPRVSDVASGRACVHMPPVAHLVGVGAADEVQQTR
jgi:hypothetical protein